MNEFFQEAVKHSRRGSTMKEFIASIQVESYRNKTFDEIFYSLWRSRPSEVGKLGVYDLAAKIYKHFGGVIDVVYLVGTGPMDRIIKLGLKEKVKTRYVKRVGLPYILIQDVLEKVGSTYTGSRTDGDELESFLCVMHKI
jgi:hypothetical protein